MIKKLVAIFCSVLIVFAFVNFALIFNVKEVKADAIHTCVWTNDDNFCVESTDQNFADYGGCKTGKLQSFASRDAVAECYLGTCVPAGNGGCLANKAKAECEYHDYGTWYSHETYASKDLVPDCQVGCCNIAQSACSLQEKKVCIKDLARGDVSSFISGITGVDACNDKCKGADRGCYKSISGCKFGARQDFNILTDYNPSNFFLNTYCTDVVGCYGDRHSYKSCGDGTEDDDKYNVYWYDSENNREDLAEDCQYPDGMCVDKDGQGGENAYCKSTKCIENCPDCVPSQLRSGESVCLNVPSGHFSNDMRSKELHNYILNCEWGEIKADAQDENRNKFCKQLTDTTGRTNANFETNDWQSCLSCGSGGMDWLDVAGFIPVFGGGILRAFGDYCDKYQCAEQEDCNGYYDSDLWAPLGSCNPKMPPGISSNDQCSKCGKGGDDITNLCTSEECNSLGDCQFERDSRAGYGATAGLALGTCAAGFTIASLSCWLGACPSTFGAAVGGCLGFGPTALYWGVVSLVYGLIAGAQSHERTYNLGEDVKTGDKINLGYAIALAKGYVQSLNESDANELANNLGYLENSGRNELGRSALLGLGNFIVPAFAAGLLAIPMESVTLGQAMQSFTFIFNVHGAELLADFNAVSEALGIAQAAYNTAYETAAAASTELISNPSDIGAQQAAANAANELSAAQGALAARTAETEAAKTALTEAGGAGILPTILTAVGLLVSYITVSEAFDTGSCHAESPMEGSENCGNCGGLEGQYWCTPERCKILGQCAWIAYNETGIIDGFCIPAELDDRTIPYITKYNAKFVDNNNQTILEKNANGKTLVISEEIPWNVITLKLNVTASEQAYCAYSKVSGINWTDMTKFEYSAYSAEQVVEIPFTEEDKIKDNMEIYIKCKDLAGNINPAADDTNYLKFNFADRPDTEGPKITYINPNGVIAPINLTSIEMSVIAFDENNVSECKYTKDSSKSYQDMEGIFLRTGSVQCSDYINKSCWLFKKEISLEGWGQSVPVIGENFNSTFYSLWLKCKDNSANANIGREFTNWSLTLQPSFNLTINAPLNGNSYWKTTLPLNVSTTSQTLCNYTLDNGASKPMNDFSGYEHYVAEVGELLGSVSGIQHAIEVRCRDMAGNFEIESTTFTILKDVIPPMLLRIYTQGSNLYVLLDEESTCKYNLDNEFTYSNGTLMQSDSSGKLHYANLVLESNYYIKCQDVWENEFSFIVYP